MIKLIKNNSSYFIILLIFLISVGTIITMQSKNDAQLFANSFYNDFFDYFFYYMSQVIEEFFAPIILLAVLLFRNIKSGIILVAAAWTT